MYRINSKLIDLSGGVTMIIIINHHDVDVPGVGVMIIIMIMIMIITIIMIMLCQVWSTASITVLKFGTFRVPQFLKFNPLYILQSLPGNYLIIGKVLHFRKYFIPILIISAAEGENWSRKFALLGSCICIQIVVFVLKRK